MKYRHNRADRFPSPPLEERARERRPCPRNTLCAPEPTRWRSLLPLLLGRRDSPELFARIAPQNRPMEEVFSLSSSGGEGWGEEAVFPGGSWAGLGRGGRLPWRFMERRPSVTRSLCQHTRVVHGIFPVAAPSGSVSGGVQDVGSLLLTPPFMGVLGLPIPTATVSTVSLCANARSPSRKTVETVTRPPGAPVSNSCPFPHFEQRYFNATDAANAASAVERVRRGRNPVRGCLSIETTPPPLISFCFFSGAAAGSVRNAMRFLCRAAEKTKRGAGMVFGYKQATPNGVWDTNSSSSCHRGRCGWGQPRSNLLAFHPYLWFNLLTVCAADP